MKFFKIMNRSNKAIQFIFVCSLLLSEIITGATSTKPNVVFLTSDDLNFDSVGVYGCSIEGITPNIDNLASQGILFERAYVQSPNCCPSRNVFQTGNYSHNSGMEGFFSVYFPQKTLPEALRSNGYFTGVIQKVVDMTPTNEKNKYWDYSANFDNESNRTASNYAEALDELLLEAEESGKPFYASVNIVDPHLPFFRGDKTKSGHDITPPSYIFQEDEVDLHPILPNYVEFKEEVTDYYNSVKRGDDCIGEVLKMLDKHGKTSNTIIVYLSDHGMSFPFSKANLYPQGVRIPWIVVWPGEIEQGKRDSDHMISAIDLMPTLLEATNTPTTGFLAGRSIMPILKGETQENRDYVFTELNEGPTADPRPTRAIHSKDFVYIFNAWGTGDYEATMECRWYRSYATYTQLSKNYMDVNERLNFLNYRTIEELYDYKNDPYAQNNLIDDLDYACVLKNLRSRLEHWMRQTDDFALDGYLVRNDPEELRAFMDNRIAISKERQTRLEWKRGVNYNPDRPAGKLTELGEANIVEFSKNDCMDSDTCECKPTEVAGIVKNDFVENLKIYPNPSNGKFTIKFNSTQNFIKIKISSIEGILIKTSEFNQSQTVHFSIEARTGIYVLTILSDQGSYVGRLLKK